MSLPISFNNYLRRYAQHFIVLSILLIGYYFCLPTPLFDDPTATVIRSREGTLLGAKIAADGQWRFPETDSVPQKFKACILTFEDQQFYYHPGFNPITMLTAIKENIIAKKVVRGGSTITQQVIRISRKGKKRSYLEKLIELILATRLELRHSKEQILSMYASHAPFGGNVVGLDMAAWRYFGVGTTELSWAENATLAVLPNAPSLIYPGKNQKKLRQKRDRLLRELWHQGIIDSITFSLALAENLPQKPYNLPREAPHLLDHLSKKHEGQKLITSIDFELQKKTKQFVKHYYEVQKQNEVHNMAVLVLDIKTRKVLSYVGNSPTDKQHQKDVDIIQAGRSTGSTLKPLLYTALLNKGELLPEMLVPDVPTVIAGYTPQNYDEKYRGAVPANKALARSLNIPAVRLLQQYGLSRFLDELKYFDLKDLKYSADHYGLSLILGGAESSLWDLCKTYAGLAGTLNHYLQTSSAYYSNEYIDPLFLQHEKADFGKKQLESPMFGAGSIWLTFEAMKKAHRPSNEGAWQFYDSSQEIAWKTGTSFGHRDAWAIGANQNYVVGVWVGNADGEGRPELTGLQSAAPLLFDLFKTLPNTNWFPIPYDDVKKMQVCPKSGFLASNRCPNSKEIYMADTAIHTQTCPYHQLVHLDAHGTYSVNANCEPAHMIVHKPWFVLPPLMAYYYKNTDASYQEIPPYRGDCIANALGRMDFIFPKNKNTVIIPKDFGGQKSEIVLKIAHTIPETKVFWYLDTEFLGSTKQFHEMPIQPKPGEYTITVLDEKGNEVKRKLTVRD